MQIDSTPEYVLCRKLIMHACMHGVIGYGVSKPRMHACMESLVPGVYGKPHARTRMHACMAAETGKERDEIS